MDVGLPFPKLGSVPVDGITTPPVREVFLRLAPAADQLGFHSLWLGEHVISPYNIKDGGNAFYTWPLYDPYVLAGMIAGITENIKIAFGVALVAFRNPVILAKMVATLDHVTNGRIIFGAGTGHKAEAEKLGLDSNRLGRRTNEYLQALRALWSSEYPEFHGETVNIEGFLFKPRPIQDRIPIWVGGRSDGAIRRMLRYGDGFHFTPHSVEALRPKIERMREVAAEEGKNLADFTISTRPLIIFQDEVIPDGDPRISSGASLQQGGILVGPPDYIAEQMARYETELGVTHLVPDLHDWYSGMRFQHQSQDLIGETLNAMEILATKVVPQLPKAKTPVAG